jgi:hypothetical protein
MYRPTTLKAILCGLFLVAFAPLVRAQDPAPVGPKQKLEGTWLVNAQLQGQDAPPIKILFTFMPGRSENDGTLIDTNEFQLTGNPVCTPDQGVWERRAAREFVATHLTFCFDQTSVPPGNPAGYAKVRDLIKLGKTGETFDLTQYIEAFDPDGNTVFTGTVLGHGVRVHAEAPPQ